MCNEVAQPRAAGAPAPPPPADEAFAKLRAFRNYYAVAGVGAYEHHFAVWFSCIEASVNYYAVAEDGTIRDAGGMWGGLAVQDGEVPAVPEAQRANADRVRARNDAKYERESVGGVQYLGSYREVVVRERVPGDGPGDPYARMVRHTEVTLRADAALTSFERYANATGGDTRLCWADSTYQDCTAQHWFEFVPDGAGEPQLMALVAPGSPQSDAERARFAEAVMAAARAKADGDPPASIDAILAAQGESILPAGFAPPVTVGFTIYGRVAHGEQPAGAITIELSPRDLVAGGASGKGTAQVGGVTFTAEVELTSRSDTELGLAYVLRDDRGNVREATTTARVTMLVDGDAAVVQDLALPESVTQAIHDPPSSVDFPGVGDVTLFDAYLGVGARRQAWWPR